MNATTTNQGAEIMRNIAAAVLVPFMMITGFRFSKAYRHATHGWKLFVFIHVNTVQANLWAGM